MTTTDCHHPTTDHDRHRDDHQDPARTGAVWVTGTGAFLLLAAAAVFVAVRWGEIPASAKLAAIGALTGGFLLAGRRLRTDLPATAGALFHLGAFLVPVDIAAVAVRAELGWAQVLLAEGLVCAVTFGLAARAERSVVLRWAAAAAVVLAAAGVGAVGQVPAPLVLAVAALAALLAGHQLPATAWAGVAGLAPVAGFALAAGDVAPGVLEQLGLAGSAPRLAAVITGAVAAGVLATVARRRSDPALALLAAASLVTGVVTTGSELDPSGWAWTVTAAAALTLVEGVALLSRRDAFWGPRIGALADVAEVLAVPGTAAAAAMVLISPLALVDGTHAAAGSALLATLWVVADLRRRSGSGTPVATALLLGGRFAPATVGIAACAPAAVLLATASGPLTAAAMLVTAGALAVGGRPWATVPTVVLAALAPLTVVAHHADDFFGSGPQGDPAVGLSVTAAVVGVAGSLLLARMVSWRTRTPPVGPSAVVGTWFLAAAAPLPVGIAGLVATGDLAGPGVVLMGATVLLWLVAAATDAAPRPGVELPWQPATVTRAVALALVLAACQGVDPWEALVVSVVATGLVLADALRRREPDLAIGLAATVTVGAVAAGTAAGLGVPQTGVALAVTALVAAGVGSVAPSRWARTALATTVVLCGAGLVLAAEVPTALADVLLLTGGLLGVSGLMARRIDIGMAGGTAITLATWIRLGDAGIDASEPYLAPVAALLLLAGLHDGSTSASSWVTTGPAIAMVGGAALVERLAGGGGAHALVAGAVGIAAVAAGGSRRLAAPLVLGTALLVVLAGHESLAVTAGVPTWAWLALGGTILLGTGIALERAQVGPLETGRRLVDVVQERYR